MNNESLEEVYLELRNIKKISETIKDIRREINMIDNRLMNVKSPSWNSTGLSSSSLEQREEKKMKLYDTKEKWIRKLNALNAYQKFLCFIISMCRKNVNTYLTQLCIFGETSAKAKKMANMEEEGASIRPKALVYKELNFVMTPERYEQFKRLKKAVERAL